MKALSFGYNTITKMYAFANHPEIGNMKYRSDFPTLSLLQGYLLGLDTDHKYAAQFSDELPKDDKISLETFLKQHFKKVRISELSIEEQAKQNKLGNFGNRD
jgi:hypothetical protein